MIPKVKLAARTVLPVLSLAASVAAINEPATNPGGSLAAAIVAFLAFYWWKEIGPQA
jgi:hypothetical protein